jgi:hypothetical protein
MNGRAARAPRAEPPAEPAPEVTWRRAPDALVRRTPRSLVALPASSAEPVRVDGAALTVWDLLAGPRSERELVAEVSRTDPRREHVAAWVALALDVLTSAGLVTAG